MIKVIESWRETPDVGELFPFDMWSSLFRGWRKKKLIALGMLSNSGKSRLVAMLAAYFGIFKKKPLLILENEMSKNDFDAAILSAVCNNKHFGFNLNISEVRIVTGEYSNEEEYEKVKEVAKYIEQNTRIRFLEMSDYSDSKITTEVKKHCLGYGVEYLFYDTMKDYGMASWEKLKATSVLLKDLCNELNIAGMATIQLTDDTVNFNICDLTSMNVASSKQVKHVLDHLVFGKLISRNEYEDYLILNDGWGDYPLDLKKKYMGMIVDKNRAGPKGSVMAYEINLDTNEWVEVGLLKRNCSEKDKKKKK
jgi:replicative DNA helicase